jgi:hypothetical protein
MKITSCLNYKCLKYLQDLKITCLSSKKEKTQFSSFGTEFKKLKRGTYSNKVSSEAKP